jgi:hypothetical protein
LSLTRHTVTVQIRIRSTMLPYRRRMQTAEQIIEFVRERMRMSHV